jgi:hypothetical protein
MAKKKNKFADREPVFIQYSPTLQRDYNLTTGQTITFGTIVSWFRMSEANKKECYPSYQTLGDYSNQHRKTVEGHVNTLRELGLLQTHQRFNDSNLYYIEKSLIHRYYTLGGGNLST